MSKCHNHPDRVATHVIEMSTAEKQPNGSYFKEYPLCDACAARIRRIRGDA